MFGPICSKLIPPTWPFTKTREIRSQSKLMAALQPPLESWVDSQGVQLLPVEQKLTGAHGQPLRRLKPIWHYNQKSFP